MSQSSWLAARVVPGVERRPLKKMAPDPAGLLQLVLKWRDQAVKAGRTWREEEMESRPPTIIDLTAELAKLTMFRGLTPWTTREELRGSATLLGSYRNGILFAGKNAGTSHWEDHARRTLVPVPTFIPGRTRVRCGAKPEAASRNHEVPLSA